MTDMFEQIYDALNVQVVTLIEQSKSINAQNEALRDALAEKTRQCLRKDECIAELEQKLQEQAAFGQSETYANALSRIAELERQLAALRGEVTAPDDLTGKWCYSTNGEEFQAQCDTEQEAHAEACEYVDAGQPYWVGQIKHPADCIGSNRSIGDDIITRADEAAYEECGGDDRAFEFSHEDCEKLGSMVREFIRREGSVNRWAVVDSVQHTAPAASISPTTEGEQSNG